MIRYRSYFLSRGVRTSILVLFALLVLLWTINANGQAAKEPARFSNTRSEQVQQPLYKEYRGIYLGMTSQEVRTKLGDPALKGEDQDFYVFSDKETAQIAYNNSHKVVTISIDYVGGVGAPDYRTVVGGELELAPNGSMYRMVRYQQERFWVSYNRSNGPVPTVTITLQQMK
jgi:hypothetical protein